MRTTARVTLGLALAASLALGGVGTALADASPRAHCLGALSGAFEPGFRDDIQLFHNEFAMTVLGVSPGQAFILTFGQAHGTPAECAALIPGGPPVPPAHPNK